MKTTIKIVGLCLILMLSVLSFCACTTYKDQTFVYDDYFVCYVNPNTVEGIRIVELTELGKEQEILILPEYISGRKVLSLGAYLPGLVVQDTRWFVSEKLKKLYIPYAMKFITYGDLVSINNATVISFIDNDTYGNNGDYITLQCRKQALLFEPERMLNHMVGTNCFFYKNGFLVWADYIADDEIYALPDELQIDWYLEPECINLWNGEYVIPDGQEKLNLYSK